MRDIIVALADKYKLTESEREELLPSGQQAIFDNRVAWAKTYLKKARLLDSPKRAVITITDRGRDVLRKDPDEINIKYLKRFPEFVEFQSNKKEEGITRDEIIEEASTDVIGKQQCTVFGNQECTTFGNKSAQKMATRMHNCGVNKAGIF